MTAMSNHDRDLTPEDLINEPLYLLSRGVSGRTFQFDDDDIFLNARPDYVLWRLFFQTSPLLENAVDGCSAGPECAIKQLTKAAGLDPSVGINNAIKWACYGLTAQFIQFAFASYPDDRVTRRIRGNRPTDENRFTDDQIARLLKKFRDLHNKRVKEAKRCPDDQYDTEKGWLLVLGACALIHATIAGSIDGVIGDVAPLLEIISFGEDGVSSLSGTGRMASIGVLADIGQAISKLFPGWQTGFSIPLWNFAQRKDGHTFFSALLPIYPDSYSHWTGEALGCLSKIALLRSTFHEATDAHGSRWDRQLAFRLQVSAIQCQEHALRFYDNAAVERPRDYGEKVSRIRERLIILVDYARTLASYAGAHRLCS
jgi:hypothetical protein